MCNLILNDVFCKQPLYPSLFLNYKSSSMMDETVALLLIILVCVFVMFRNMGGQVMSGNNIAHDVRIAVVVGIAVLHFVELHFVE